MIADGRFALVKTTLLDYPGRVAASVFLPGCNLRCPYCHNPEFVDPERLRNEFGDGGAPFNADSESFSSFLEKRASLLGGIVFSGGEALMHPLLPDLIERAKDHGLPVKLDTAGLLPGRLMKLIDSQCLDYVAMDFKASPDRYGTLGWEGVGDSSAEKLLGRSIKILASSGLDFEVRTTVVPGLVGEEDLERIAEHLNGVPLWVWQSYAPGNTLDPDWSELPEPGEETLSAWKSAMKTDIPIRIR